ncbi:MAG: PQQ-binding-like beta-propeller repeat protein [Actinomycetota bacterium]|nr:PQQ-binding-like beta-propeller repeat protein [Actinomycetota bacterium]
MARPAGRGPFWFPVAVVVVVLAACSSNPSPVPTGSPPIGSSVSSSPVPSGSGEPAWPTYHRDGARTGFDPSSPALGSVRQVWTSPRLDGAVYAEPLVLGDRVFVATEGDSVYALDAATGDVAWRTNLGGPVPRSSLPCGNIDPTGITGTPAIDPAGRLLYAVDFVQPGRHELVALDVGAGRVRFRRSADPPGLDPLLEQQRGALAISGGRVFAAFGGLFGDCGDYHGAVVGVALDGSGPLLSYLVPSGRAAGIWGPSGPAVDPQGNLLVATGNSDSGSDFDFGDAVIRLSPDLKEIGWFAPSNWAALDQGDIDLGSVGPAVLSNGLAFQIGKEGVGYLVRPGDLGQIGGEAFSASVCSAAFGGTASMGAFVYVPCTDGLVALKVDSAGPSFSVAWRTPGFEAGPPIVSGGAVWSVDIGSGDLVAFDSADGHEVFRAPLGAVTHFATPAAVSGRLYVAATDRVVAFSGI